MKPFTRLLVHARAQRASMLLCMVAGIAANFLLFAYVDALHVAVQRGEALRRVQRSGGVLSSAEIAPVRQPDGRTNARVISLAMPPAQGRASAPTPKENGPRGPVVSSVLAERATATAASQFVSQQCVNPRQC